MPWMVKVLKAPEPGHFRPGFFPRRVHYKWEAESYQREVAARGGLAYIENAKPKKSSR